MNSSSSYADLRSVLRQHGVANQDIDDVAQEIALAAFRSRLLTWEAKPPGASLATCSLKPIVSRILTARLARERRMPVRLRADPGKAQGARSTPSAEDAALASERAALVRQAMVDLEARSPALALVVHLHDFGGHSISEVARILHVSASTARSWERRARAALRDAVLQARASDIDCQCIA